MKRSLASTSEAVVADDDNDPSETPKPRTRISKADDSCLYPVILLQGDQLIVSGGCLAQEAKRRRNRSFYQQLLDFFAAVIKQIGRSLNWIPADGVPIMVCPWPSATTVSDVEAFMERFIISAFNQTQDCLHAYQSQVQDWLSSRPDSFFLNHSLDDLKKLLKQSHLDIAHAILRDFESRPEALAPVHIERNGKSVRAELLLRKRMLQWLRQTLPQHEDIMRLRKEEAEKEVEVEQTNESGRKQVLAQQRQQLQHERQGKERDIVMASSVTLLQNQESFWRELIDHLTQLVTIVTRIWKLISAKFQEHQRDYYAH